jgi:hypothetical protein
MGEYLSRVFLEVKGRPTYLIASVVAQGVDVPDPVLSRWRGRPHRGTPASSPSVDGGRP